MTDEQRIEFECPFEGCDATHPHRHRKVLWFTPEGLATLVTAEAPIRVDHVFPRDATVCGSFHSELRQCFGVVLEHPEFQPVWEGEELPALAPPTFVRLDDD